MARKRADLMAAGRPEGRDVMWVAMRELGEFTLSDIEAKTRIKEDTIRNYVVGLTCAGYLEFIAGQRSPGCVPGHFIRSRWRLVNDVGAEAPRVTKTGAPVTQGDKRENMWRSMKILGEFDRRELAAATTLSHCVVSEADARFYCRYLQRAGYLSIVQAGGTRQLTRYRFVMARYTGPKPPKIQRIVQVWDPNISKVAWPLTEDEQP